jgi:hypothetical protein
MFGQIFSKQKLCIEFDEKMGWVTLSATFFTNPSGHPVQQQ